MNKQARTGRRPKLNAYRFRRIVTALKAGNFVNVAAPYGGIGRTTFYRWMKRGEEEGSGRFYRFYRAVKKALAHAEVRAVGIIRRAMATNWKAAMTWLERRHPVRWRRVKRSRQRSCSLFYRCRETAATPTGRLHLLPWGSAQAALSRRFLSRYQSTQRRLPSHEPNLVDVAPPQNASLGANVQDADGLLVLAREFRVAPGRV